MARVLVTGGAGYVGSHCIIQLLEAGFKVVAFDNFANCSQTEGSDKPEPLRRAEKLTGKELIFEAIDLCDKIALKTAISNHEITCVLHLAAVKSVGESCKDPIKYYANNCIGSINLIQVMNELGIKNIVFSSSATVYGIPQYLPLDEKHPAGECTNPYGRTKFCIEQLIRDVCAADSKWRGMILRYFNPVGAHPSGTIGEDPTGVPYNLMPFVAQVSVGRQEKLVIYGTDYPTQDGTCVRDYVHVMDVASGHVAAIKAITEKQFKGIKLYNLGIGKGTSVLKLVKSFEEASGVKIKVEKTGRRDGDVPEMYSSCDLIEKDLGWKAEKTFQDMCRDVWNWQSKNPNGFK